MSGPLGAAGAAGAGLEAQRGLGSTVGNEGERGESLALLGELRGLPDPPGSWGAAVLL